MATQTLPPGTTITTDNLAQALAELIARLPEVNSSGVKPGDLVSNSGVLGLVKAS